MISYITTPLIIVAVIVIGTLKLTAGHAAVFCFTLGVICLSIGYMEVKTWQRVKKDVLALDGLLQLLTGASGVICGAMLTL